MNTILRFWKKLLFILITGSTSLFIAACYGMPVGYANLGNWTIKVRNEDNEPIQGLEVTVLQYTDEVIIPDTLDIQHTDSLGTSFHMLTTYNKEANHRHEAIIKDIDGSNNGGLYSDTLIVYDDSEIDSVNLKKQ